MQAGLGGGSADAAAALLALARLWGGVPLPLVRDVAGGIGADVAYFLSGGTALGLGRGEEIYPLVDLPTHWVVDRAAAVRHLDRRGVLLVRRGSRCRRCASTREPQMLPVPWPTRAAQMINDLEPPVVRRHPEIGALQDRAARGRARWRRRCRAAGRRFLACFARQAAAARALKPVSRGGARARLTRTLSRAEHERRARPVATKSAFGINLPLCGQAAGRA